MRQGDRFQELGGQELGIGAIVFATLGAPVAWAVHLGLCYFLVALACTTAWRGAGVTIAILVATLVLAAVSVASGVFAYRRWRAMGGGDGWDQALSSPGGKGGFYWMLGVLMSGLFTLVIVLEGLGPLFVDACQPIT